MGISANNISKRYKEFVALDNVSLQVKSGELVALLGPSGSGKTSLLRIISGLDFPDSGNVVFDGKEAQNNTDADRHVGFVFQHYALFKHMTVFENIAFGLRVRNKKHRPTEFAIRRKVVKLLNLVHLEAFWDRYPSQLSGGQRQRVALARALAVEPQVLLLDEPFGALDAKVRKELRRWMRKLHNDMHITSIFVTHDQEEAMEVADRVVVMNNSRIEQVGTPEEVYHTPASAFVYDFMGNYNEFDGWKDRDGRIHIAETDVIDSHEDMADDAQDRETESLLLPEKKRILRIPDGAKPIKLYARPHEMLVSRSPLDDDSIQVKVIHINPAGPLVKMELESNNGRVLQAEVPKSVLDKLTITRDDTLFVRPKETKIFE
jgi:sulfate/thiosulfate transport system ATP-binding protein